VVEVRRRLGNEKEGGYEFRARAPCLNDASGMSDLQVMQRFIQHNKKQCPCNSEA